MKRYLILLFICSILSIHATARKAPEIAVYNVDSVLSVLPEYETALNEYIKFDSVINLQLLQMEGEYQRKINEFNTDSAKWRPIIREIKRKETEDLRQHIDTYRQQAFTELEERKKQLREPLEKKIAEAAAVIGKEKGVLAVICNQGCILTHFSPYWDGPYVNPGPTLLNETISQPVAYQDPKTKTVNITKLLIEKLKQA